jgi:hypothetical protein
MRIFPLDFVKIAGEDREDRPALASSHKPPSARTRPELTKAGCPIHRGLCDEWVIVRGSERPPLPLSVLVVACFLFVIPEGNLLLFLFSGGSVGLQPHE